MSRRVHPTSRELNSRRSLLSSSRDDENELDLTSRSVPAGEESDEEDTVRDNIQKLIQKEDYKRNIDDRSEAMNLLSLRQNLTSKNINTKGQADSFDGEDSSSFNKNLKIGSPVPFGIILPDSTFMTCWTVIVLFALIYTATVMPYLLAFSDDIPYRWLIVEMVFDIIFAIDFGLNFNIAYYDKYDLVVSRAKILKNYATGWMILDLMACFPFSLISLISSGESTNEGKLLKIAKLPRVTRIIRIFRLVKVIKTAKFVKWYNETMERLNISSTFSRGLKFFGFAICLLHLISCAWYFVDRIDGFSPDTWVVRYKYLDKQDQELYLISIYWGLTVLDTIGYGDIVPVLTSERILCLIWLIFGVSFYSYAISNLSVIFYNMNTRANYIKRKEEYLNEFAHNVKLPKHILKQVKFHVRYNYRHNVFSWSDMNNFLKELPSKLYTKVYNHIFKDVLDNITFFKSKPPAFISELMPLLKTVIVHEGNELYSYGSSPRDVFFLLKGRVMVKDKSDAVLFSYVRGSYFGEIELLYKSHRKSSIQVEQTAQLLKVDGQDFLAVIERFQEIKDEIEEVASKRHHYFMERKKKLKEARKRLGVIQQRTMVDLFDSKVPIKEIFEHKMNESPTLKQEVEREEEEEEAKVEEENYGTLAKKIANNVQEIKNKIGEVSEFFEEVMVLKKE